MTAYLILKNARLIKLNLDEALMELQQARFPLIDQTRRTGEKPSTWDLMTTGIPEKIKVWYQLWIDGAYRSKR